MCGCSFWNSCWRPPVCQCQCQCACPVQHTLSGMVTGVDGPVANFTISYTINGVAYSTTTDANGRYTIIAPRGAAVVITPQPGVGVTVTPVAYTLNACQDRADLNFVLAVV